MIAIKCSKCGKHVIDPFIHVIDKEYVCIFCERGGSDE